MDKLRNYRKIARELATYAGKLGERPNSDIKTQFVFDDEHGHYLLYFNGWRGAKRTYGCYLHIEVTDDAKIWVHHDGTDLKIAQLFVDKGIPKSDIVLGFHAPVKRPDSGFAVA
ncbi:MAG: XisI protein [Bacteroidetes bacterium]|nr:XisI protein [Bacteroidota bacterium]